MHFTLMPAIGENDSVPPIMAGPNRNQGDISGFSDHDGFVILNNIEPGKYYLVVWSPYSWLIAESNLDNEDPLLIELTKGNATNQGIIYLPLH